MFAHLLCLDYSEDMSDSLRDSENNEQKMDANSTNSRVTPGDELKGYMLHMYSVKTAICKARE